MPWRSRLVRAACAAVVLVCTSASAQVFRCPSAGGLVYQQGPCPGLGAGGGRLLFLDDGRLAPLPAQRVLVPRAEPMPVRVKPSEPAPFGSPKAVAAAPVAWQDRSKGAFR